MKINQNLGVYLQIINVLSFVVVLVTIIYTGLIIIDLPDNFNFSADLSLAKNVKLDNGKIWEDIRLMVTTYLIVSVVSIYLLLLPHSKGNGKSKALVVSLLNFCIAMVFSITIIKGIINV